MPTITRGRWVAERWSSPSLYGEGRPDRLAAAIARDKVRSVSVNMERRIEPLTPNTQHTIPVHKLAKMLDRHLRNRKIYLRRNDSCRMNQR